MYNVFCLLEPPLLSPTKVSGICPDSIHTRMYGIRVYVSYTISDGTAEAWVMVLGRACRCPEGGILLIRRD